MVGIRGKWRLSAADEAALKRLAIQIAAQLPDDMAHANAALDYTRMLLGSFLGSEARPSPAVIALVKP